MKRINLFLLAWVLTIMACNNAENPKATQISDASEMNHEGHDHGDHADEDHEDGDHAEGEHDHGNHDHGNKKENADRNISVTSVKNAATSDIIDAYLGIKNALAGDDKSKAAASGGNMLLAISKFDMSKLSKEQHEEYMDIIADAKEQTEHIIKSPIDHQREHFEVLSTDVNDLISLLGTDKTLYETLCPMANDGKGAIWLSETKEIKNPFFGSKMYTCGKIQKQIN